MVIAEGGTGIRGLGELFAAVGGEHFQGWRGGKTRVATRLRG